MFLRACKNIHLNYVETFSYLFSLLSALRLVKIKQKHIICTIWDVDLFYGLIMFLNLTYILTITIFILCFSELFGEQCWSHHYLIFVDLLICAHLKAQKPTNILLEAYREIWVGLTFSADSLSACRGLVSTHCVSRITQEVHIKIWF